MRVKDAINYPKISRDVSNYKNMTLTWLYTGTNTCENDIVIAILDSLTLEVSVNN